MEMIAASLALSFMGALVKGTSGLVSPMYVMWFRSLCHIIFLMPLLLKFGFQIRHTKTALARGLCGTLGMALYFVSLQQLPLVLATAIFWIAPLFTLVIAHLVESRAFKLHEVFSVLLMLSGIVLIASTKNHGGQTFGVVSLLIAVVSSIAIGSSYYFLGMLAQKKESTFSISYSFSSIMLVFTTPFALSAQPSRLDFSLGALLVGAAALAIVYQFFITRAYAKYSTAQAAIFQAMIIPVTSVLIDRISFHQTLSVMSMVGIGLLMLSQIIKAWSFLFTPKKAMALAGIILGLVFTAPPSHALTAEELHGTWTLVSYFKIEDGVETEWCKGYFGTLSYFGDRMSVSINCVKRSSNDSVTNNRKDMVFYSGTYEVRQPNAIVHHVENSSDAGRIGHDHIRYATLQGNEVVLTGVGVKGDIKLIWRRTSK